MLIAIYLHLVEFNLVQIGLFLSAALAGAAVYTLSIMFVCDTLGRRRLLIAFAIILAGASAMVASMEQFPVLIAVAFLGAFSVAGGGAAGAMQPLEQSSLSETVAEGQRTDLYAIYGIMGTGDWRLPSSRLIFTLSGLFSVDHFAGGLVAQSLVSLWFFTKCGIKLESIALIFFGSNLIAAVSLWVAAKLANRIGLINTMVITHIPASVMLIAIPFLPKAGMAASFWLVRSFFGQMDVPTRQPYTMAVVGPNERSPMAGVNSATMSVTGTVSPSVATALWNIGATSIPFVSCGVLKISYDLALWFMFRKVKPPEKARRAARAGAGDSRG